MIELNMAVDGYRIILDNDLDEWSDAEAVEETNEKYQNELRKIILSIQNDLSISQDEKAKKVQELMTFNWRQNEKKPTDIDNESVDDLKPTYTYENSQKFGCKHYQRGSKLQAECCKRLFTCRFCHDEKCDHKIDRQTIQPASKSCNNCKRELARYYCDKCKFWDDHPLRDIYHCDHCGICRQGRGLEPGSRLHDLWGISIFINNESSSDECFEEYSKTAYQCPTCCKSIANMEIYFRRIDAIVAQQKMPPEYEHFVAHILCNDCEIRSTVSYHFSYHKCPECRGYNTKVLEIKSGLPENNPPKSEGSSSFTVNSGSSNSSQAQQSSVTEVTGMMQRGEGSSDREYVTEHQTRHPMNSIESNNDA
ncbi:35734_t:CDS:2 [Racocetra persica]|uniref:35734_t:CDS:1 n=1 Tax=Racocetra persica TaxID=160502 RepID=A0ACA9MZ11_9GLOM|nr:35734_t:CDS:2 [Racocetra persica]